MFLQQRTFPDTWEKGMLYFGFHQTLFMGFGAYSSLLFTAIIFILCNVFNYLYKFSIDSFFISKIELLHIDLISIRLLF